MASFLQVFQQMFCMHATNSDLLEDKSLRTLCSNKRNHNPGFDVLELFIFTENLEVI
jgi:hypothetical protein